MTTKAFVFQRRPSSFRIACLALGGHLLYYGSSMCTPHPQYCWGERDAESTQASETSSDGTALLPLSPGPEQSGHCGTGAAKTLIPRPVPNPAAPTYLTVLHDGVVRGAELGLGVKKVRANSNWGG